MFLSRHQNAGQNCHMKVRNKSFDDVAKYKYLGRTATNQIAFTKKVKSRSNLGNVAAI